jgi:RNA polymerase sigma-70 factor, ECF subfamily
MDGTDNLTALSGWPGWTVTVANNDSTIGTTSEAGTLASLDDAALVRLTLAGERDAFGELTVRHRRAIYKVCYRFTGNHEDAADLAQDAFLRAYRALGTFKGDAAVATWLYRIAVNLCLNKVAVKGPRTEPVEGRNLPSRGPDAFDALVDEERAARVRSAISQLPPKQRATLILRVYRELPHQEIAHILGSSVGAVKANFFHALNNLRRLLQGEPV